MSKLVQTCNPIRVTVWNEGRHEQTKPHIRVVYPDGIHGAIMEGLQLLLGDRVALVGKVLDDPSQGLSDETLESTDVLIWWGHTAHKEIPETVVQKMKDRVLAGMGLVALHSSLHSRIFMALMGTSCDMRFREAEERHLIWTVDPTHPIARGVPHPIVIPRDEMFGEFFDIPCPDELVFVSSFSGGEVFRSGCCFRRGNGRVFFFSPGHETAPIYYQAEVRQVIANAVLWAHNPNPSEAVTKPRQSETGWFEAHEAS